MLQSSSSWSFLNRSQSASLYDVPSCESRWQSHSLLLRSLPEAKPEAKPEPKA
jgi:hypothetical protein